LKIEKNLPVAVERNTYILIERNWNNKNNFSYMKKRKEICIEAERNYHNIHNLFYSKRIAVKPKNYDYYENIFQM
jgi:hypothetical protein